MSRQAPQPYEIEDAERRRVPRWAWVTMIGVALVALIVVVVMLSGGGHTRPDHGGGGEDAPDSSVTEDMPTDHTPPDGAHG